MRRACTVNLVALACLVAGGSVVANEMTRELKRAARHVQKADASLRHGRIERARQAYRRALDVVPGFPEAHIGLGNIAMHGERFQDALERYEQARDGYADFADALSTFRRDRYTTAQSQILEIEDKVRLLEQPATSRGDAAYQISKLENEASRLRSVLPPALDGDTGPPGEIYFFIGNALYRLGRIEEAIANWRICCAKYPRFALSYNNLAVAYWRLGQPRQALDYLDRAEELGFAVNPQFKSEVERAIGQPAG